MLQFEYAMLPGYCWQTAYLGALLGLCRFCGRQPCRLPQKRVVWLCVLAAAVIQLPIALFSRSHSADFAIFSSWARSLAQDGFSSYYVQPASIPYPPGWLPVLWLQGRMELLFGWESGPAHNLLYKLPGILLLSACALALARTAARLLPARPCAPLAAAAACAFCPALWADSTLWGQLDLALSALLLLAFWCAEEKRTGAALFCFAAAILFKPQALAFAPAFLALAGRACAAAVRARTPHLLAAPAAGIAGGATLFTFFSVLCRAPGASPFWLFAFYRSAMHYYALASLGAMNFYGMLGLSGKGTDSLILILPADVFSRIAMCAAAAVGFWIALCCRRPHHILYAGCAAYLAAYTFMTGMHERYLSVLILPLLLLCLYEPTAQTLRTAAAVVSVSFFCIQRALLADWMGVVTDNNALSILCSVWIVFTAVRFCAAGCRSACPPAFSCAKRRPDEKPADTGPAGH